MDKIDRAIREYVDRCGDHCPVCKGKNLEAYRMEFCSEGAYQDVECHDCGSTWSDTWTLTGIDNLVSPDDKLSEPDFLEGE